MRINFDIYAFVTTESYPSGQHQSEYVGFQRIYKLNLEDTKGDIRIRKLKNQEKPKKNPDNTTAKRANNDPKPPHRKLKPITPKVNSFVQKG